MIIINRVFLIGRLVRNPEMRTTTNNTDVTRFTIAVTRKYQNEDGERQAVFINCVAFKKLANNIEKYCIKGSQVAVEGRIQTGSYEDQNGTTRYTTDIMCDNVTFLDSKKKESLAENTTEISSTAEENAEMQKDDPFSSFADEVELSDDEMPWLN